MTNTDVLSSQAPAAPDPAASSGAEENALTTPSNGSATPRKRAGLSGMVLAELRELAGQLGITGTAGLRKGDLIAAIKERQGGTSGRGSAATPPKAEKKVEAPKAVVGKAPVAEKPAEAPVAVDKPTQQQLDVTDRPAGEEEGGRRGNRRRRSANRPSGSPEAVAADGQQALPQADRPAQADRPQADRVQSDRPQVDRQSDRQSDRAQGDTRQGDGRQGERGERHDRADRGDRQDRSELR
ncbi:Rho termination factor N-terminal domain-containing protein, partial [Actinosynnema sp. NPDC023658]|uniref:Rho termination factor N-terminal domain-containing protein n=1 Tax=Actinosynnema sp. NPDC023658 TaxID=3155465 RepID=UPI0033F33CB0